MIAMGDLFIFGFGLAVTVIIVSTLSTLIVIKNRAYESDSESDAESAESHDKAHMERARPVS